LEAKIARLTSKHGEIKSQLEAPGQTPEKVRSLTWREKHLSSKIENIQRKLKDLEEGNSREVVQDEGATPRPGPRGGCGGRGRGRFGVVRSAYPAWFKDTPEGQQLFEALAACRTEFRQLKKGEDVSEEAIQAKWEEVQKLQAQFREAKKLWSSAQ
jgi:hypothetical protein